MNSVMKNLIEESISKCKTLTEENVKIKVVVPALISLGYSEDDFDYEHNEYHRNKFADIAILMKSGILYVEVKRGDKELTNDNISQLASYLYDKNIEWGILTNGSRYILLNSKIEVEGQGENILIHRVVFDESTASSNKKSYINYFSMENIFVNKSTTYFKHIAQFKAYKYPTANQSWKQYKSTLYCFSEYLIEKYKEYRDLNNICFDTFSDYWAYKVDKKKEKHSLNNCKKQYRYLASMIKTLNEKNCISNINFKYDAEKKLEELYNKYNENKKKMSSS